MYCLSWEFLLFAMQFCNMRAKSGKQRKSKAHPGLLLTSISNMYKWTRFQAGVSQLVEYKLPKLGVAGSIPVTRSRP